jgi:hypothetical protein
VPRGRSGPEKPPKIKTTINFPNGQRFLRPAPATLLNVEDDPGMAELYKLLTSRFGNSQVFKDVNSI